MDSYRTMLHPSNWTRAWRCTSLLGVLLATGAYALPTVPAGYNITVFASGAPLTGRHLSGLTTDPSTGNVYVALDNTGSDPSFDLVRFTPAGVSSSVGSYNIPHTERIEMQWGPDGRIYVGSSAFAPLTIFAIDPSTAAQSTFSVTGVSPCRFGLQFDSAGNLILYDECNETPFRVTPGSGVVSLGGYSQTPSGCEHGDSFGIAPDGDYIIFPDSACLLAELQTAGHVDGTPFPLRDLTSTVYSGCASGGGLGVPVGNSIGAINPLTGDIYSTTAAFGQGASRIIFTPADVGPSATSSVFVDGIGNGVLGCSGSRGVTGLHFGPRSDGGVGSALYFLDDFADTVYEVTHGVCGNGIIEGSEQCDDGNTLNGDCCSATCQFEGSGSSCSDGNACTQTDACDGAGHCVGTNPLVCSASDQCHNVGTCNPSSGVCSSPPLNDGTPCGDGNACTKSDVCTSGVCGGTAYTCAAPDQCHQPGTCNGDGTCSFANKANGTVCDDGTACTKNDKCTAGVCGGTTYTCAAPDQCHQPGTCNGDGTCSFANKSDGTTCSDGNACTLNDTCQSGACQPGAPKVCTASDQCHVAGTCNTNTGLCSNPKAPNGTSCNDGNACTFGDKCLAGQCVGDPFTHGGECDDHNPCTEDSCNPAAGCQHTPNTAPCDDGNACTSNDTCSGGRCAGGTATSCDDGNPCTDDSCSAPDGCVRTNVTDGTQCTSGSGAAGACAAGSCCTPALGGITGVPAGLLNAIEQQCPSCPRNATTHTKYVKCVKAMAKVMRSNKVITTKQQKAINKAAQQSSVGR